MNKCVLSLVMLVIPCFGMEQRAERLQYKGMSSDRIEYRVFDRGARAKN